VFQWGHFFSEMDSWQGAGPNVGGLATFQLGHFFSEMDSLKTFIVDAETCGVSIGPLLFRNG
jgi:hypothetical protein